MTLGWGRGSWAGSGAQEHHHLAASVPCGRGHVTLSLHTQKAQNFPYPRSFSSDPCLLSLTFCLPFVSPLLSLTFCLLPPLSLCLPIFSLILASFL